MDSSARPIPLFLRLLVSGAIVAATPFISPTSLSLPRGVESLFDLARQHPRVYGVAWLACFVLVLLAVRAAQRVWFNEVKPRLAGTYQRASSYGFAWASVDLLRDVKRVLGSGQRDYFVGRTPPKATLLHKTDRPIVLTERQRTMHLHVMGYTGSGKTASVVLPLAFQDILRGKPVVIISAKGSDEEIRAVRNMCAVAGRSRDLRIFSLPFPHLSHAYNPLHVVQGDPLAVSERVFSVFARDMEEPFYRNSADAFFRSIISILHGVVDDDGRTKPFTFHDVLQCVQNPWALEWCLQRTSDRDAAANLKAQLANLGQKASQTLMGLQNLVQNYTTSPLLNVTAPDIVMDEVFERGLIVYWQLPANYYAGLTQAVGKMVLQEIQQAGARRQVFRDKTSQAHAGIFIDEFYNFAFDGFIDALNKLRDANFQFTLSHQSISDLERVSKEFATGVWDNTRTKIILYQNNPALCEQISASIGTRQTLKRTSRHSIGELAVSLDMGEQSVREVEEFRLHPNAIKSLRELGQAYLVESNRYQPMNLGCLPDAFFHLDPEVPLVARRLPVEGIDLRAKALAHAEAEANRKMVEEAPCLG